LLAGTSQLDIMERTALLIIAPEWRDRAVLAAELGERLPYAICSAPTPAAGAMLLRLQGLRPVLCLVESGEGIKPAAVQTLRQVYPQLLLVVIYGVYDRPDYASLIGDANRVLQRPVAIAEVVQAVKEVLAATSGPGDKG